MLKKLNFVNWRHWTYVLFLLLIMSFDIHSASAFNYKGAQFHGFIMQSYVKSNTNNFFGNSSDSGSFGFTEIGVTGSLKIASKLQLAVQFLSRRAGELDDGSVKLDFALADYRLIDRSSYGLGLRAGRVKNPIGFYNETRDVSFTRSSVVLPQSIYFERTRDVMISSDSVHVYGHRQFNLGILKSQMGIGLPRVEGENAEYALLGRLRPGEFSANPSFVGRVQFLSNDSRLTTAISHVNLSMDYDSIAQEGIRGDSSVRFKLNILSLSYNLSQWSFTGEYAQRRISANNLDAYIPPVANNQVGESYYFQTVYRLNHKWNLIGRYDVLFSDRSDRDGSIYAQKLSQFNVNSFSRFAKDMMAGIQYTLNRHWMGRVEYHDVDGTAWLPLQDNLNMDKVRKWRMLNLSVSYRF